MLTIVTLWDGCVSAATIRMDEDGGVYEEEEEEEKLTIHHPRT